MGKPPIPKQYLGAFKAGHRASAREYIDEDMAYELLIQGDNKALAALEWLTKFNNEYYRCVVKKGDSSAYHNTNKLRKEVNNRSNSRRRDLSTVFRDSLISLETDYYPTLEHLDSMPEMSMDEDLIIEIIDAKLQK